MIIAIIVPVNSMQVCILTYNRPIVVNGLGFLPKDPGPSH